MMKSFSEILSLLPADLPEDEKAEAQRIRGNLKNLSGMENDPKKEAESREHKKAVAEVWYILTNLDEDAASRIPASFMKFLEDQKWENYAPAALSRLRDEAYSLLDIAYRHFLAPPEERPRLQLRFYVESCVQALGAGKQAVPLGTGSIIEFTSKLRAADSAEALSEVAKACGLEKHLQFIIEKEEKITLLFS
jgi:hypothetical protein